MSRYRSSFKDPNIRVAAGSTSSAGEAVRAPPPSYQVRALSYREQLGLGHLASGKAAAPQPPPLPARSARGPAQEPGWFRSGSGSRALLVEPTAGRGEPGPCYGATIISERGERPHGRHPAAAVAAPEMELGFDQGPTTNPMLLSRTPHCGRCGEWSRPLRIRGPCFP